MFDWFKGKNGEPTNVVPFPGAKSDSKAEPESPKEKPAYTFYRIGVTDNQRISFQMGYSEITMTRVGAQQLIDQLTVFMNQLPDEENNNEEN